MAGGGQGAEGGVVSGVAGSETFVSPTYGVVGEEVGGGGVIEVESGGKGAEGGVEDGFLAVLDRLKTVCRKLRRPMVVGCCGCGV